MRGFFTDPSRADDSFIPFKSYVTGNFTFNSTEIDVGFRPSFVVVTAQSSNNNKDAVLFVNNGNSEIGVLNFDSASVGETYCNQGYLLITDTGFKITNYISMAIVNQPASYMVCR